MKCSSVSLMGRSALLNISRRKETTSCLRNTLKKSMNVITAHLIVSTCSNAVCGVSAHPDSNVYFVLTLFHTLKH